MVDTNDGCGSQRQAAPAFAAPWLRDAQLRRLLDEPLTRPLGSMLSRQSDDEITLVQDWSKRERLMAAAAELTCAPERLCVESPLLAAELSGATQSALRRARKLEMLSSPLHALTPRASATTAPQTTFVRTVRARLPEPDAPPRSSALFAGIVDGWERVPSKTSRVHPRRRSARSAEREQLWATAAVLAVLGLVLAFALTLRVVPRSHVEISGGKSASSGRP
ncbi:MAG TPA: hypothetical protein VFN67_05470 [Polyangiales bacterium]|nr:hypothetical protein [Polyangiales bacterium]